MSSLMVFQFESQEVRFIGTADKPWWVVADVCAVLEIKNPSQAIARLDDDERSMFNIGRQGEAWCVNESGLYSLVLSSRKPQAKRFKKWITSEVIPSIRKTGSYSTMPDTTPTNSAPEINLIKEAITAILNTAGLHQNLIAGAVGNALVKQYPELKGAVEEAKKLLPLPTQQQLITVTELAALYNEKFGTNLGARAVNKVLEGRGLQRRNPEGNPDWLPLGQGNEFASVVLQTAKGRDKTVQQLRWFPSVLEALEMNDH